jgi:hypothetical protein
MTPLKNMIHLLYSKERSGKEQDRVRERKGEEREAECCGERVAAWVIDLTVGQVFMRV